MNDQEPNLGERVDGAERESMPMSGLEKARATLLHAGLAFPQIPEELACQMEEREEWVFSTREVKMWPYDVDRDVDESFHAPPPYAVLANSGYGINSYVLAYYLVFGPLRLFLHLSWGGVYTDPKADAAEIKKCFSLADEILPTAMSSGKLFPDEYLTIVCSDFYGNHWGLSLPEYVRRSDLTNDRASELLAKILNWLNDPKPRRSKLHIKPRQVSKPS